MADDGGLRSSNRNCSLYLAGATVSAVGSAMVPVALSFALLDVGLRAGALGLVLAAQTIPTVALLLVGGVAGDRWSRRGVMIGADLLRCGTQMALASALIAGLSSLALLVLLTALIGVGNAFFGPASSGFLVDIVQKESLARANGALRTGTALAMIVGPSAAGLIVMGAGPGWTLGIDGLSYVVSGVCLLLVKPRAEPRRTTATRHFGRDLREGLKTFAERRWLWLLVGRFGLVNMLAITVGFGALAGALGSMKWQPRRPLIAVELAVCLLLPLLFLIAGATFPTLRAGGVAFGVGAAVLGVLTLTVIQRDVLSRVTSVVQLADMGLTPMGFLLAGPAAALLGGRIALMAGASCVLSSVAVLLGTRDIRGFGTSPDDRIARASL